MVVNKLDRFFTKIASKRASLYTVITNYEGSPGQAEGEEQNKDILCRMCESRDGLEG